MGMTSGQLLGASSCCLEAVRLCKVFRSSIYRKGGLAAVDGVDLLLKPGERISLVGESGSGKTTLAKMLVGLIKPTSGKVLFGGIDMSRVGMEVASERRRAIQLMPQYPDLAFDPTWYVYDSIAEPLRIHRRVSSASEERAKIAELCDLVELGLDHMRRRPDKLSGGEVQRAVFARCLALEPRVIVFDEPTSMLDPSTQAKLIHVFLRAQREQRFASMFITHDLKLAPYVSERILIMLGGRIVEAGETRRVLSHPFHPYTSYLVVGGYCERGKGSSAACHHYHHCAERREMCMSEPPPNIEVDPSHSVRCWKYG